MPKSKPFPEIDFQNTKTSFEHYSHFKLKKVYSIFALMNQNWLTKIGTFFIKESLKIGLPIKKVIKSTIFEHFCGGENISECKSTISELHNYSVGTILDYSVEGEDNENDFDLTKEEIIKTIHFAFENKDKIPFSVFKVSGLASVDLLEKKHIPTYIFDLEEQKSYLKVKERIEEICQAASDCDIKIFFDAEETWIQNSIDDFCLEMMQKFNNKGKTVIYNTYQLYRTESYALLCQHYEMALKKGFTIGAKLVRGAYMEKERKRANEKGYKDPINENKLITDSEFDKATNFCIDNSAIISICLGTHNEESCKKCLSLMEKKGLDVGDQGVYFAQLLGMSDNISFNLAKAGFNVAKYVPYGPVEAVMPYLFRRADENTSIAGQTSREFTLIKKELKRRLLE